jgi:hypothetical protein
MHNFKAIFYSIFVYKLINKVELGCLKDTPVLKISHLCWGLMSVTLKKLNEAGRMLIAEV